MSHCICRLPKTQHFTCTLSLNPTRFLTLTEPLQVKPARKMKGDEMDEEEKRRLSLTKQPRAPVTNNTFALHVAPVLFSDADTLPSACALCHTGLLASPATCRDKFTSQ